MMLPGPQWLSMARSWHFFFAWIFLINGLLFILYAIFSRHLSRDLAPTREDLRGIGASIREHLRFKHPGGEAAKRYNVLQKLAYLIVIFGFLPLIVLMGFAMSPWLDAVLADGSTSSAAGSPPVRFISSSRGCWWPSSPFTFSR